MEEKKQNESENPNIYIGNFENCGNLESGGIGRDSYIQNNPKIRFLILSTGLPGSGKSKSVEQAISFAKLLNSTQARKKWVIKDISHDDNVLKNGLYKKNIKNLLKRWNDQTGKEIWTPIGWAGLTSMQKNEIEQEIYEAYKTARVGKTIKESEGMNQPIEGKSYYTAAHAEQQRQRLIKEYGFSSNPNPVQEHRGKISVINDHNDPNKSYFTPKQIKKLKVVTRSGKIYREISNSIINGYNLVYEFTGTNWETAKLIMQKIVELTNNCEKYTYIVISTFPLITPETAYRNSMCRFFEQCQKFVEEIKAGGIWNITNPASGHPLLQGSSEIKAPRLISFNQYTNIKIIDNIINLILV